MRTPSRLSEDNGYVLLAVVMAITLLGILTFMLNRTTGVNVKTVASHTEMVRARYVAEAGIAYGKWFLSNSCQDAVATDTPFQGHTFDVTIQNTSGNNYHITAVGNLSSGENNTMETDVLCNSIKDLFWSEWNTNSIWGAELDGSSPAVITVSSTKPIPLTIDSGNDLLYWREPGVIRRVNIDGTGAINLISCGSACDADGLAVDPGNKLYWTNSDDTIRRANVDGSGLEVLINTGLKDPIGIALDLTAGKMYWAEKGNNIIKRANLDGTGVTTVISGLSKPHEVAIDPAAGKIYYYELNARAISRANLDGSGIETLVTFAPSNKLRGIALDPDNGKIYWTEEHENVISRANLDGSSVEIVANQNKLWGIAVKLGP